MDDPSVTSKETVVCPENFLSGVNSMVWSSITRTPLLPTSGLPPDPATTESTLVRRAVRPGLVTTQSANRTVRGSPALTRACPLPVLIAGGMVWRPGTTTAAREDSPSGSVTV